jgi:predicted transcriptional regulator
VKIRELMQEYDLEIDDLRWHLSTLQAERLLSYREKKRELIRLIWSGSLEGELYDMEERFLAELQNRLDKGSRDEIQVREILKEVVASREMRYTQP